MEEYYSQTIVDIVESPNFPRTRVRIGKDLFVEPKYSLIHERESKRRSLILFTDLNTSPAERSK